jgi:cation diffusion facilitator CzcD-associated flavoprotein CzcO
MSYRAVIIGAGFGGIGMAIALTKAGIEDFVVVEKAADLGGTWRDNSYPGLTCDIPSQLYSFSFRPWRWSRRFPARDEIMTYLRALVAEHGLSPRLRFGSGVASAAFDERRALWDLVLEDGSTLQAATVVCSVGQLGRPVIPGSQRLLAAPMLMWRRQLRAQIADPGLRAKCVPDYVMGCKRVVFSNDWYPALARPNVELVTDPIDRIASGGVVTADGTTRAADVIIYATGFRAAEFLAPMQVSGLGGRRLQDAWRDGAQAYLGITVSGFPNFFMLYGPNTNLGGNSILFMLEGQIGYVLGALRALDAHRLAWLDVRPEVQDAFSAWVQTASRTSVWESGCHNWYTTDSGRNTNNWPSHTFMYRYRVRRFDLSAYRVMPATADAVGAA